MPYLPRPERPNRYPIRATLTCGHAIHLRDKPLTGARYSCEAGLGCGYRLHWTAWQTLDGTRRDVNTRLAQEPPDPPPDVDPSTVAAY